LNRTDTRPISLSESIPREDGRPGEILSPKTHAFRVALFGSLTLHALAAISFWYAFGSATWERNTGEIVDTLVHGPSMDLDVCLQLDDPASVSPKKVTAESAQLAPEPKRKPDSIWHADDESRAKPPSRQEKSLGAFADGWPGPSTARPQNFTGRRGFEDSAPATPLADSQSAGSPDRRLPVSFFRVGVQARSVVYVIDRSASMGLRDTLGIAKRELLASLNRLSADTRFQIIIYNRAAECFRFGGRSDLVPASLENKQQAARLLESVRPEGSTDPLPALRLALALRPEAIFFLTDADDFNIRQVNLLTQLNAGHTAIHAIELNTNHPDRGDQPLQLLARTNHGEYHAVTVGDQ
jgi:hypothetical protein